MTKQRTEGTRARSGAAGDGMGPGSHRAAPAPGKQTLVQQLETADGTPARPGADDADRTGQVHRAPGQVQQAPGQVQQAPEQIQHAPGQVQHAPEEVQRAPGQVQRAPEQVQRAPGQVQRASAPSKIVELHGSAAEDKLAQLGGRLVTDPDYSDGHKAIKGSHVQYTVLGPRSAAVRVGVHQWTHDGPDGFHMQSITGVGRVDAIPSAAVGPNGLFVNTHNVGSTTIPLARPGTYRTRAWVRAGVDERGVFVGYELTIDHVIEVTHIERAMHEAEQKLPREPESFDRFRDTMAVQTALLRPGDADAQNRDHPFGIATGAPNPARISEGTLAFSARDARKDRSRPVAYHWYVSPQTKDRPPETLGGRPMVTASGRRGYDLGAGGAIAMPAEHAGFWVVWYQAKDAAGGDVGEASYLQTILSGADMKSLEKHDDYMARTEELAGKIDGEKLPVRAVHVSKASGHATQLRLFLGKKDPSTFLLVDATPGLDPKANRLEYTSSTGAGAIDELLRLNKYPEGRLRLSVKPNRFGIDAHLIEKVTTGDGAFDRLSSNLSAGGMVALGIGILAAPVTRGQSLQVAMVVAGGLNAAASAVSLYERLQHAEISSSGVALDVISIASSLVGGGGAIRSLAAGPGVVLAHRATRFLLWASFVADGASALLVSAEGVQQIAGIIDNDQLRPEQKREAAIRVVTSLIMTGTLLAVSYGQAREHRAKLSSSLGAAVADKLGDEACITLSVLDDAALLGLKGVAEHELGKLVRAIRDEAAVINLVKAERRLPKILPLMKDGSADELRLAILRIHAHEAGVSLASTERLVDVVRVAGISADTVAAWGPKAFARLASDASTLAELEKILPLVKTGRITGLDHWLAFGGTKISDDAARTAGELREAARQAAANPQAQVDVGGDFRAPRSAVRPGQQLRSFDMEIKQGGTTLRSVEVGTVEKPIKGGAELNAGVSHAIDKIVLRNSASTPIAGKHEVTIRMTLAKVVDQKAAGVIEILPNGDRVRITRQKPPARKHMTNIFDEFTDKITDNALHGLLDRINLVDASSGTLLAQYDHIDGIWKKAR